MSSHVLFNLLNELRKRYKKRGLSSILSLFYSEFNKFNITRAGMLYSIYHMTLKYINIALWREDFKILTSFKEHYNIRHYVTQWCEIPLASSHL